MPSFIDDYLLTTENSKPDQVYHLFTMLGTLSAAAGRRFWFPFGPYAYYCNLYVVLVGDPGTGKSSAMNRGKNILRAANICPIAATQITKEALTMKMSSTVDGKPKKEAFIGQRFFDYNGGKVEYNQYAIFATELVEFIAVNPQGFLDFLTSSWDEPIIEVETKNKGQDYVVGPYITLLACMTPEKLKGFMKHSILTGGFARRTAFMFTSNKNIIHWPTFTDEQKAAEQRCIQFIKQLQTKSGAFSLTPECITYYETWNQENELKMRDRPPTTRGWYESKGEMLFKISMLVVLADKCGESLVIDVDDYKVAQNLCLTLEKDLERVFEGSGINPNSSAAMQICRMLESLGQPMNRKKIEAMFFDQATSLNELRDTIGHLIAVDRLKQIDLYLEPPAVATRTLLGTVIGTPASMQEKTSGELAEFL